MDFTLSERETHFRDRVRDFIAQEIAPRRAQEAAGKAEKKGAAVEMDEIMNKVGAYWLGQRANKEISSAGDDIEVRGTKPASLTCSFLLLVMFR